MLQFLIKYKIYVGVMLALTIIIMASIFKLHQPEERLPVYQPNMIDPELVDSTVVEVRKYHTIGDFELINQNGDTITPADYEDKIYIADFFFTTCQDICPIMTEHMLQLQETLKDNDDVLLLSHTVIPAVDDVARLKAYALEKGVNDEKWNLVTGDKKHIYDLARKHYLAAKSQGDGGPFDMIHTENFMLVDKKKRIRGFYDGTDPKAIQDLLQDLKILQGKDS